MSAAKCECSRYQLRLSSTEDWCYRCGSVRLPSRIVERLQPQLSNAVDCLHKQGQVVKTPTAQWCETCGAVRGCKASQPKTRWQRPGGPYGSNPGSLRPLIPKIKKECDE